MMRQEETGAAATRAMRGPGARQAAPRRRDAWLAV